MQDPIISPYALQLATCAVNNLGLRYVQNEQKKMLIVLMQEKIAVAVLAEVYSNLVRHHHTKSNRPEV